MTTLETGRVHMLAPKTIARDPLQPRKSFDQASLKELAASITALGVLQPLVVRQEGKKTYLVAGERRLRARNRKRCPASSRPAIASTVPPSRSARMCSARP